MSKTLDRSTGPIPRDEFKRIIGLPYGEAKTEIRKYDPLYGMAQGEKIKWKITFSAQIFGEEIVEAASEEEAAAIADEIETRRISFDNMDFHSVEVESIEPEK